MTELDGVEEVVLLFDADMRGIVSEMHASEFSAVVEGSARLEQFAASAVKAAFAVVEIALSVRSIVFFTFKVDEKGLLRSNFNLPLRYLADSAGPGPDLGTGPIRLACRGQCPVPWHSVNLWQPLEDAENGSIQIVQNAIWRNQLGLKPSGSLEKLLDDDLELTDLTDSRAADPDPETSPTESLERNRHTAGTNPPSRASERGLESRLTETFGEDGRLNVENLIHQHNNRLTDMSDKFRTDLQEQQRGYLEQIKSCREEIQQLKSSLRSEQQRSRRLQGLLRGDP